MDSFRRGSRPPVNNSRFLKKARKRIEFYIARHVITESNKKRIYMGWIEEGLALEGREQAKALGQSLQSLGTQQIYVVLFVAPFNE
jgi:broad specificity phosphatase PhoE